MTRVSRSSTKSDYPRLPVRQLRYLFKGLTDLHGVSGYRQFDAISQCLGAIALPALFATRLGKPPVLGDITALLLLAQPPAGRIRARSLLLAPGFCVVHVCNRVVGRHNLATTVYCTLTDKEPQWIP